MSHEHQTQGVKIPHSTSWPVLPLSHEGNTAIPDRLSQIGKITKEKLRAFGHMVVAVAEEFEKGSTDSHR